MRPHQSKSDLNRPSKGVCSLIFSEYLKMLYPFCCGSSNDDEDGDRKSPAEFVVALLSAATTEQDDPIFDKTNDYLRRIYNGKKRISQKSASYVLTHLNKLGLEDTFLNAVPSEDARVELCGLFEPYIGNATIDDIAFKLANLFVSILKIIAQGKKGSCTPSSQNYDNINLEMELSKIIKRLASLSQEELDVILRFEPSNIDKKILKNEVLLRKEIKNNVAQYYTCIEELLKQSATSNSLFIDRLLKSVQFASENYIEQISSQQQVFEAMVTWLKNKAISTNDIACRIMVSFFVQNCEVFREVTK